MIHLDELSLFHRQLLAIHQSGFPIAARLMRSDSLEPKIDANLRGATLQEALADLVRSHRNSPIDFSPTNFSHPVLSSQYSICLNQWLSGNQTIDSLDYLMVQEELQRLQHYGTVRTMLQIIIYLILAICALVVVWSLSIQNVGSIIDQLRVQPTGLLSFILTLQQVWWPAFIGLILLSAILLFWLAWRWIRQGQTDTVRIADIALEKAGLAKQMMMDLTQAKSLESHRELIKTSPLLQWVQAESSISSEQRIGWLSAVERLYLWLSEQRDSKLHHFHARLITIVIGGGLTLLAGWLLFYPLVQLLYIVIVPVGVNR